LNRHHNIRIIIQPPYSPELNPVEKLWQYIKDKMYNVNYNYRCVPIIFAGYLQKIF
jgi:transposase